MLNFSSIYIKLKNLYIKVGNHPSVVIQKQKLEGCSDLADEDFYVVGKGYVRPYCPRNPTSPEKLNCPKS